MDIRSGECALIIDGQRYDRCSCALEQSDASARPYGFLSGPSEILERAMKTRRVEIALPDQPVLKIKILTTNAGIALFTVVMTKPIRLTISSRRWVAVVEGGDVREVCIRAEEQLREKGLGDRRLKYQVLNASRREETAIVDYMSNAQRAAEGSDLLTVSPEVIRTLQLLNIDSSIRRAEQIVSGQRRRHEKLMQEGWPDDLPRRLLDNLTVSLDLLNKHRDFVRQGLIRVD
jgi:hypothetical protein